MHFNPMLWILGFRGFGTFMVYLVDQNHAIHAIQAHRQSLISWKICPRKKLKNVKFIGDSTCSHGQTQAGSSNKFLKGKLTRCRRAAHKAADCSISQAHLLVFAKNHGQWHQHFHNKI